MEKKLFVLSLFILFMLFRALPASAAALPAPQAEDPDVRTDRLCPDWADPEAAPDKRLISCRMEYGEFAKPSDITSPPPVSAKIVAYNMERGIKLDSQIKFFKEDPDFKDADVLLLSEVDRGCSRSGSRNVARDLAKALEMDYLYAVEFVELPRDSADGKTGIGETCEHGNAILSRHRIAGAEQIRHQESNSWYIPPGPGRDKGQPRLGGRTAIAADINIKGRPIRVYTMHLESAFNENKIRGAEALELIEHAKATAGDMPVIMGGDVNSHLYINDLRNKGKSDLVQKTFFENGYEDAHAAIPVKKRGTTHMTMGMRVVIDLIFLRGAKALDSGICNPKICDSLSDHLPIWTQVEF